MTSEKRQLSIVAVVAVGWMAVLARGGDMEMDSQSYFTGCGEIVSLPYPHCDAFASDTGEIYLLEDTGGFEVGDRVFVDGEIDSGCLSSCYMECLANNTIEVCTTPPGDLNGDGVIDTVDLLALLDAWGACEVTYNCPADLNGDGVADTPDLLELLANWG